MLEVIRSLTASMRFRLVAAACLVLLPVLIALVANSVRILDDALLAREDHHLSELKVVFNTVLSPALSEGNLPRAQRELQDIVAHDLLRYAVLRDAEQRVVAAEGQDVAQALPVPLDSFAHLRKGAPVFDGRVVLQHEGRPLGTVHFGIDTRALRQTRAAMFWQSTLLGALAFVLIAALLWLIACWLTRNLAALQRAVAALEEGQTSVRLPEGGRCEVGRLARAFNRMSQGIDERVEALKKSESRFHAIADYTYGVEAWFNPQGRLIWVNRSVERVTGYTALDCLVSTNLIDMLVFGKDVKRAREVARKALDGGTGENFELRFCRKDGSIVWTVLNWQSIHDPDGAFLGLRVSVDDIQDRKEAELKLLDTVVELRRAQALKEYYLSHSNEERLRLEALLNVMRIGVLFVDSSHRLVYINDACRDIWLFTREENVSGMRDTSMIDKTTHLRSDDAAYRRHVQEVLAGTSAEDAFEIPLNDGRIITERTALVPGEKPGQHIGRVWTYEDVTHEKRLEAQLIQLAERDPLTNLYNRRRFHEEIERIIAEASRRASHAGLLAIDLDGFKPINDEFGHQAGDVVLVRLAEEVGATVRRNEIFFRIGGDEFAILAPDADEEEMVGLARRVSAKIAALRFDFEGREARITASLGIALYPNHADNSEDIIARADLAMYQAKMSGKNRWNVYDGAKRQGESPATGSAK